MRTIMLVLGAALLLTVADGVVHAQDPPFELTFDQAADSGEALMVPAGGWPLSLTITVEESRLAGVGGFGDDWGRPSRDWRVLLVTDDPDGCPSWLPPRFRPPRTALGPCARPADRPWPRDETWIELWPNGPSSDDPSGDTCDDQPQAWSYELFDDDSGGANTRVLPLGPRVAEGRRCYGRHPQLPQLVLLADAGPSVVTDLAFHRVEPRRQRNLAGFFQSFGFAWRDGERRRSVSSQMIAPPWLFSSAVAVDTDVSRPPSTGSGLDVAHLQCSQLLSFDGGPTICREALLELEKPTLLRAFLVAGEAPDVLVDANGDGRIDAEDARAAGLVLLSNEAQLRVQEHLGRYHFDVDLDGDGRAATYPLPGSPVDLTDPPP